MAFINTEGVSSKINRQEATREAVAGLFEGVFGLIQNKLNNKALSEEQRRMWQRKMDAVMQQQGFEAGEKQKDRDHELMLKLLDLKARSGEAARGEDLINIDKVQKEIDNNIVTFEEFKKRVTDNPNIFNPMLKKIDPNYTINDSSALKLLYAKETAGFITGLKSTIDKYPELKGYVGSKLQPVYATLSMQDADLMKDNNFSKLQSTWQELADIGSRYAPMNKYFNEYVNTMQGSQKTRGALELASGVSSDVRSKIKQEENERYGIPTGDKAAGIGGFAKGVFGGVKKIADKTGGRIADAFTDRLSPEQQEYKTLWQTSLHKGYLDNNGKRIYINQDPELYKAAFDVIAQNLKLDDKFAKAVQAGRDVKDSWDR